MDKVKQFLDESFAAVKDAREFIKIESYQLAHESYNRAEDLLKRILNILDYDENQRRIIVHSLSKLIEEHNLLRKKLNNKMEIINEEICENFEKPKQKLPPVPKQYAYVQSKIASAWKDSSKNCGKRKYEPRSPAEAAIADLIESQMHLNGLDEKISLKDIAGLSDVKKRLREAIEWPTLFPELCTGLRSPITGLLLFGPPGTGKTKIAKALASLVNLDFFNVAQSTLVSKEVGESEKILRILFDMARFYSPSIIFFDEIDSIGGQRLNSEEAEASRRLKTELLLQMDGVSTDHTKRILVIAATNFPWNLDEALRRRFEKRIFIPLPDYETRLTILKSLAAKSVLSKKVRLEDLAARTEGYSGADIVNLYSGASESLFCKLNHANITVNTIEDLDPKVEKLYPHNFETAFENIRKSVNVASDKKFKEWAKEFGSM